MLEILKQSSRPELINSIDETFVFHQLTRKQLGGIIKIQLRLFRKRLDERGLMLNITDKAIEQLCDEGFDSQFGARPLKRVIQHRLENPIATGILSGTYDDGDTITVDVKNGDLTLSNTTNSND